MTLGADRLTRTRWLLQPPMFDDDPPGGGGGGGNDDPPGDDDPPKPRKPEGVTPEIQEWINGLIARQERAAAEKAKADLEAKLRAEREKEERERQRKEAEAKGEFEQVKASLQKDLDEATAERDRLKAEHEALSAYFDAQYAAALKELPEAITELAPDENADFATRAAWLTKATAAAKKLGTTTPRGNGGDPPPRRGEPVKREEAKAQARARLRI